MYQEDMTTIDDSYLPSRRHLDATRPIENMTGLRRTSSAWTSSAPPRLVRELWRRA